MVRRCLPARPIARTVVASYSHTIPIILVLLALRSLKALKLQSCPVELKKYSLGSCLPHVLLHQTIIGEEVLLQMEMAGDILTSSSVALVAALILRVLHSPSCVRICGNGRKTRIVAVEPTACPTLNTRRVYV